jgi:hypothetical protein
LRSDELADLEPSTRGAKKNQLLQTLAQGELDDLDVFQNGAADIETEMGTSQCGEGLATANKELFSVQHQGLCDIVYAIETSWNCFILTQLGAVFFA